MKKISFENGSEIELVDIPTMDDLKGISITDESIMPFGRYKGAMLITVPDDYLWWLFNQKETPNKYPFLFDYLEERLEGYDPEDYNACDATQWDLY